MTGSRSDQIPVHVPVSVEAAGEVAVQRYEYRQPRGRGGKNRRNVSSGHAIVRAQS